MEALGKLLLRQELDLRSSEQRFLQQEEDVRIQAASPLRSSFRTLGSFGGFGFRGVGLRDRIRPEPENTVHFNDLGSGLRASGLQW